MLHPHLPCVFMIFFIIVIYDDIFLLPNLVKYAYVYTYVYIHMYTYTYVYIYVYLHMLMLHPHLRIYYDFHYDKYSV